MSQIGWWDVGLVGEAADTVYTISKDVEVIPTFDSMGLNPDLLRGIYAYGRFYWRSLFWHA